MQLFNMFSAFNIFALFAVLHRGCWATSYTFPDNFLFGTATSAYQIEGAWNESGKGENIWDRYTHDHPERILDGSNGDIACDSYHKYEEDIKLLKELGVDFYRFSLSWTRIFPSGFPYNVNYEGINYYNNILNLLAANNITAMVTLFHWDLPQSLMDLGGLTNPKFITYYTEYARTAFEHFGDRVKYWLTFNEPFQTCVYAYGDGTFAPGLTMSGIADYLCGHNLLKAHAAAYHLYNTTYRSKYEGKIAISISAEWFEPNTTNDEVAAERIRQFWYGMHIQPIFSSEGDYPEVVKEYIAAQSSLEGYKRSRLPQFTQDEINYIKGTSDFMGLNHYNTYLATNASSTSLETSYYNDIQASYWLSSSNMEDSDTARVRGRIQCLHKIWVSWSNLKNIIHIQIYMTSTESYEVKTEIRALCELNALYFQYGMHIQPIFSSEGDYPEVVKEYIAAQSSLEGYKRSRLPQFTQDEINYIKGTSDFMGLNHYNSYSVSHAPSTLQDTSYHNDYQATYWRLNGTNLNDGLMVVPWGFRSLLAWLKNTYNDPEIFVTENGYGADFETIDDRERVSFYGQFLEAVLEAIHIDNVRVIAYTAWSLMDNFEWNIGYTRKYGIYYVNFTDPDRPRIPKSSAHFFKNVIGNRTVVSYERIF
ncbi:myrosinase 1-like [Agrilus planipennis]|uniref:Myrosinase 1-like n=1 Tax=Agrilus planipennis TaxID=224129 RepID=A0A7F5R3R0_AGRPL|nr:myrosinase 1-like [Agrilus planipennis]